MCSFFSEKKKPFSHFFTLFLYFFSALFLSFLVVHIRERERDGERERVFSFVVWGRRRRNHPVRSLSLCFSLSCCDAYRSERR